MRVKQISVFLENRAGRLDEVTEILAVGLLRMRVRREKEREFSPDNCLAAPIASSPHATGP